MKNKIFLCGVVFSLILMVGAYAQTACSFGSCDYTFPGKVTLSNTCGSTTGPLLSVNGPIASNSAIVANGNMYIQSPSTSQPPYVFMGLGERQRALRDAAAVGGGVTFYGVGWDSTSGQIGFAVPSYSTVGIYGIGASPQANFYVSGNRLTLAGWDAANHKWIMDSNVEGETNGLPGIDQANAGNVIGWTENSALPGAQSRTIVLMGDVNVGEGSGQTWARKNLWVSGDLNVVGNSFATTRTGGAIDIAEWVKFSGIKPEAGDVVCIDAEKSTIQNGGVVKKCDSNSNLAIGIVSTKPHMIIGNEYEGDNSIKLAISGRVPVNVEGNVKPGDLLISSYNGKAKSCLGNCEGKIVGKSLTPVGENGQVLVLVSIQ